MYIFSTTAKCSHIFLPLNSWELVLKGTSLAEDEARPTAGRIPSLNRNILYLRRFLLPFLSTTYSFCISSLKI